MLPVQVGRFCLLIFCAIIVSLVHFTIAQYSHINHPLFVNQDLYSAASSGWDVAWDSAWDPWSSGWSYPNTLSYDHKYKPKHAIFEAAEVLLIGKKKNETIRGVIQIYQFVSVTRLKF